MSWVRNPLLVDRAAAAIFFALCVVDVLGNPAAAGPAWLNVLGAAGFAALLLVRRRAPLRAAFGFYALLFAFALWLSPPSELVVPFFGLLFFPYAVAVHGGRKSAVAVLGALPLVVLGINVLDDQASIVGDALFPTAIGLAAYLVGRAVRSRLELAAELHEAALRAQEAEEAEAARAVLHERRRIAREMHDVVAHSISVMVVQAGGARRILAADPERAVAAGAEIERVGRDALLEMRRLLGALNPREGGPEMAPQPGMGDVAGLLERARAAGLPVEMHEEGERRTLTPGMDLALYRVLQEALTNSLKHSGPASTDVRLCWMPDCVELEVLDEGPRGNGFVEAQGLIGMRERVRLYGGELVCARRPQGGFQVLARIPFTQEEPV